MKEIFWGSVNEVRKLGSFAFVCLAIVIWVGVKACFAFFQDAILHSLQECLLIGKSPSPRRVAEELHPIMTENAIFKNVNLYSDFWLRIVKFVGSRDADLRPNRVRRSIQEGPRGRRKSAIKLSIPRR